MSDSHQRINKEPADARPMLDFVRPQTGSHLRTPLVLTAALLAVVFVFQEYQPWVKKEGGAVVYERPIDTPLAEIAPQAVAAEAKTEIKQSLKRAQSQPQSPPRRSPRVIAATASKSKSRANAVRAALPENKAVDVDAGFAALPEVLVQRKEPRQEIIIPVVTFNHHGRLMESKNE